jgi:hypothetical protein
MGKIKWGGDIEQSDIDNAEVREGRYIGEIPPSGVYRFRLKSMKVGESNSGNPKLQMFWVIDGSWQAGHKKYDGCPLFDHMPVTKSSAFRAKALCAAIGVSSADFTNKVIADADGYVTKIGKLAVNEDLTVFAAVKKDISSEQYGARLTDPSYMAPPDADDDDDTDGDDDADDDDTPF